MGGYIRGKRQLLALYYFWECLWRFWGGYTPIRCAKRELEIFLGFAKPYNIIFAPSFWESYRAMGATEEDIKELKEKFEDGKKEI